MEVYVSQCAELAGTMFIAGFGGSVVVVSVVGVVVSGFKALQKLAGRG